MAESTTQQSSGAEDPAAGHRRRGAARYFVTHDRPPRRRRASDAILEIVGVTVLFVAAVLSHRPRAIEESIREVMDGLPEWLQSVATVCTFASTAWAVVLLIAVVSRGRRRLDLLRDILIAIAATLGSALLLARLVEGEWVSPGSLIDADGPIFPVLRAAGIMAVAVVSAPHFTRPVRRAGAGAVVVAAIAAVVLGQGGVADAVGGVALGLCVGSAILLVFGSPLAYPDFSAITDALQRLGLPVTDLQLRNDRSWGERVVTGEADHGLVDVKVLGRDAEGAAALSRAWRTIWYRDREGYEHASRVRTVEHEALMTKVAAERGLPVPAVRTFGLAGDDLAIIALDQPGTPLAELDADDIHDDVLAKLWAAIGSAHAQQLIHGLLNGAAILVRDGDLWITNWGHSTAFDTGDSEAARSGDVILALFAVAARVGVERTLASARDGLGDEALTAALPYLQLPAVPRVSRVEAEHPKQIVRDLSDGIATALGIDPPEPVKLRRVTFGQIGMLVLVFVAANALIGMLGGIDFEAVWAIVQDATWAWFAVAFVIGQTVFFADASGMLFAVGQRLPFAPLTLLQVAVKFIGLAVPSAAGRVTMNAAFLHKYGLSATVAATQGAIDGVSGFMVESTILLLALVFGDTEPDIETGDVRWSLILLVIVLLGIAAVLVVTRVQKLRDLVLPVVGEAWSMFRDIMRDPRRAAGLLGANFLSRLILGVCLWFVLEAIGTPLPLITALVVTVATNLLAGLVPIPGGIGVAEATMTALLALAGIDDDAAFAAAVVFRVITFYLPAVAGLFATRWLQNRDYL